MFSLIISLHGVSLSQVASTPNEAVDITAKAGFKYIELPVTTWKIDPETITNQGIKKIKDVLSAGVEASSIGMIWPRDYMMVTTSPLDWNRNISYAHKLFDFSAMMNVKVLNLGGPEVRSVPASIPYLDGLRILAKFWKEACRHAEDVGVIVAIEHIVRSHISNVADTTKQIIDLVRAVDSPSFQIMAQVHQMVYCDLDVPAAIKASGELIKLVHIADVPGFNPITDPVKFVVPGQGKLDFLSVFRAFKAIKYDGEFCLEPSPNTLGKDYISELTDGRRLLEAKWEQA
ncbi:MAG: endonuc 2 protein [Thermoproteota archaeon]|nr:endonuc 2 protein [Thermoproteota archaeon]